MIILNFQVLLYILPCTDMVVNRAINYCIKNPQYIHILYSIDIMITDNFKVQY